MKKVTFTVTEDEKQRLEALSGGNLSAFCRDTVLARLSQSAQFERMFERQSANERQLADIARILKDGIKTESSGEGAALPDELISCIFETLYLLRLVTQPAQRDQAKSAIERIGLPYIYNNDIANLAERTASARKG